MSKILIVDDESDLLEIMSAWLQDHGYEIVTAADGPSALEMAKKHHPELVILDLMLPKMDGYKVTALLKTDSRYSKIPILLFTAKAPQEEDQKMQEEARIDACLTKPFVPEAFLEKVRELIGK